MVGVIGSGVAGLSAASVLASKGRKVEIFEKNQQIGGRARQFKENGFVFDMGPSWYWMPDVLENFFERFGHSSSDHFELTRLDPAFQTVFKNGETITIPGHWEQLLERFEAIEKGAAKRLEKFMEGAKYKYQVAFNGLVQQPGLSMSELLRPELIKGFFRLQLFSSFKAHVRKYFKDERLISIMEFPILFLGAMPKNTPALYSLMNYTGLKQGTFYPKGGFGALPAAMKKIAEEQGVRFHTASPVENLGIANGRIQTLETKGDSKDVEAVIGTADYHHVEQKLLPESYRNYQAKSWEKKTFSPSCLLFYLGVNKRVDKLLHHNLFFDGSYEDHARSIYQDKEWPTHPLFYVCCPSKTDPDVAPAGKENLFLLVPIASGLNDEEAVREAFFNSLMDRLERYTETDIRGHLILKKSYCVSDFERDYNAYKGHAYGLANTLRQTANLKPKMKNKKLKNLYYAGHTTVPGPGVPPSIISGEVAADQLSRSLNRDRA